MTFKLTHLYPGKRRKLERSTSYHQQDHKTRGGWSSKHHRRLCLGIVFLSIIATLTLIIINHTTTPDKSLGYENSTPLIQSFCRRYNSFCFEDKKTPLSSSSLEHDALGYATSRIVYDYDIPTSAWASLPVRGALYMTVKNEDLQKVRETMRSLNDRLNHRLNYPWILLCNEGFTEDFIKYTSSLVPGPVYYGKIDPEALVYPSWINLDKVKASDQDLPTLQMMRYQSGLFYHHSLFSQVQYVWRIDPGMTFSCTMDDPFATMVANNKTYGVAATRRYQEQKSTEKIWKVTKNYMDYARSIHQEPLAAKDTIMQAVVDQHGYTSCHFWSLFEILSVEFLKSAPQQRFFEYMDHNGAFFYEKLTDSVYRTMAVAMYLKTDQIYFFNEIGFKKEGFISHCPLHANHMQKCACDIQGNDLFDVGSCSIQFLKYIHPSSIMEAAKFIMMKSDNKSP